MTTETWSGLSARTPQSKRRSHKAANADGALKVDRLRVLVRQAERHCHCACGKQRAEDPLHPLALAESPRAISQPMRGDRAEPAAEGTRQDVERPVHAHHR